MSNRSIGKNELIVLSPSLIYIYTKGVCADAEADELQHDHISNAESKIEFCIYSISDNPIFASLEYGYGTIAVFIVCLLGLLGIFLMPCFNKLIYQNILTGLTALAISTLFCDAMLHILPVVC
jgi:hypothetical protein